MLKAFVTYFFLFNFFEIDPAARRLLSQTRVENMAETCSYLIGFIGNKRYGQS